MKTPLCLVVLCAAACGPSKGKNIGGGGSVPSDPVVEDDPFCDALARVIADTPNDYANLRGEVRNDDPDSALIWESPVILTEGTTSEVAFQGDLGSWSTSWDDDGEGMDQLRSLQQQIASCPVMNNFTLEPFEDDMGNSDPDFRTSFTWANDASGAMVDLEWRDPGVSLDVFRAP